MTQDGKKPLAGEVQPNNQVEPSRETTISIHSEQPTASAPSSPPPPKPKG